MIEKTPKKITLSPFEADFIKDTKFSLLVVLVGGVAGFFIENQHYKGISWGFALCALGFIVWHLAFSRWVRVIFDLHNKAIYRKNLFGEKKLLHFHEATLLCQSNNYGSQSYHIAKKSNRYKSLQRISGYLSESEFLAFEKEVVSQILPLLDNPKMSKNNEQNVNIPHL